MALPSLACTLWFSLIFFFRLLRCRYLFSLFAQELLQKPFDCHALQKIEAALQEHDRT